MKISKTTLALCKGAALLALFGSSSMANAEVATYTARVYPTTHATGLKRTAASRDFLRTSRHQSFEDVTAVPGKYSLRGQTGPIEDQGNCGSCWDFALTTTLRGSLKAGAGQDPGRLSFNYLLNCTPTTIAAGCDGGDFPAADMFIHPKGAPAYGSDGAYTETQGTCSTQAVVASTVNYKLLGSDLGAHPEIPAPSFRDIAYVVGVLHQPVSVDVAVDAKWQGYSHGTYNGCSATTVNDLNHMVVIEGYSCETSVDASGTCVFDKDGNLPAGVGTWLVRNSWGPIWGDQGYITTKATDKKGNRCNSIATDALYFELK